MSAELDQLVADTISLTGSSAPPLLSANAPILSTASLADSDEPMYLIGLIGGIFPAIRAARTPIVAGLQGA